jgi:hypothetical protein
MTEDQQDLFDPNDHATPLSLNQLRSAEMLAMGCKRVAITESLDISLRDLMAWERLPGFQGEVKRIRSEARELCVAELRAMSDLAVGAIKRILTKEDMPPGVVASTAFKVLDIIGMEAESFVMPDPRPAKKSLDAETLRRISAEIYGIHEPE